MNFLSTFDSTAPDRAIAVRDLLTQVEYFLGGPLGTEDCVVKDDNEREILRGIFAGIVDKLTKRAISTAEYTHWLEEKRKLDERYFDEGTAADSGSVRTSTEARSEVV